MVTKAKPVAAKAEKKPAVKAAAKVAEKKLEKAPAKAVKPAAAASKADSVAAKAKTPAKVPARTPAKPRAVSTKKKAAPQIGATQRGHYVEVAAYFIAERRGFAPGDSLADWLEAEAQVDRLLAAGKLGG